MALLQIEGVSKHFGQLTVLDRLSFEVEEGSVFGFIGTNGSGKTTTMKIVVGLLKANEGAVYVGGRKVEFGQTPTNRIIGYLPDVPEFYGFMNALEYLRFCGKVCGMNATDIQRKSTELIALVGLEQSAKRRIKGYSRGMKQRLGIAQALIHDPALLICDEPTSALDPQGRSEILAILSRVRERTTVLFSTHILNDVERVCDTIGILHHGNIALGGNLEQLKSTHRRNSIYLRFAPAGSEQGTLEAKLCSLPFVTSVLPEQLEPAATSLGFMVEVGSAQTDGPKLLSEILASGFTLLGYQIAEPSLESLYLEVIA
ncbi:MAG: ABC transporter ATP-binding protein [Coriobacteriaceae bacterium]|jgi:ABC-2 type transport system ATP-binding protein|nr:ABC transporter ATP-binding protein [Coriobacteriaceae bacterium]